MLLVKPYLLLLLVEPLLGWLTMDGDMNKVQPRSKQKITIKCQRTWVHYSMWCCLCLCYTGIVSYVHYMSCPYAFSCTIVALSDLSATGESLPPTKQYQRLSTLNLLLITMLKKNTGIRAKITHSWTAFSDFMKILIWSNGIDGTCLPVDEEGGEDERSESKMNEVV